MIMSSHAIISLNRIESNEEDCVQLEQLERVQGQILKIQNTVEDRQSWLAP